MKEIGGYFGLEPLGSGQEYYPDLIAVNNARNALVYLLRARNIKKLYIPHFLCDSVSAVCEREGCAYEYYSIDKHFLPIFNHSLAEREYLYVVNYYGQLTDEWITACKKQYCNVILDHVQAFFQKPVFGVDTVYSCRKFFGVPDGGYVATTAIYEVALPQDSSKDRMKHVLGRFEGSASDYYSDFKANDRSFATVELRSMSNLTHNLLGAVDYEAVRQKRNENYAILKECLESWNPLSLRVPDGAYAYPFYCANGMEVKKRLAEKKIFVATLWPNVLQFDNCQLEKDYTENILPLPCDQRYDAEDMRYVAREVLKCIN